MTVRSHPTPDPRQPSADARAGYDAGPPPEPPESVVVDARPAARAVLIVAAPWLLLLLVPAAVALVMLRLEMWATTGFWLLLMVLGLALLPLAVAGLEVQAWRCTLTDRRVAAAWGIVGRASVEARLEAVQRIEVTRTPAQRLLGLATVTMTTAARGPAVLWPHLADADAVVGLVRARTERRIGGAGGPDLPAGILHASRPAQGPIDGSVSPDHVPSAAPASPAPGSGAGAAQSARSRSGGGADHPPVIGLVGGIGAGKSTVARAFERLGALVIDSDARAKAALDRPDVRDALVSWWGEGVLAADGRVDRARVASIVFADPAQRLRLEALVHPIVRQDRADMTAEAARGARAVIVDAPLLFEAGVDADCDAVVFVDAPAPLRAARVRESRGWAPDELARREASQLSLDEKRRRSNFVVDNSGGPDALAAQAAAVLDRLAPPPGTAPPESPV